MEGVIPSGREGLSATEEYAGVHVDASEEPCMPDDAWENLDQKADEESKVSHAESDAPGALLTRTLLQGGSSSHRGLGTVEPPPHQTAAPMNLIQAGQAGLFQRNALDELFQNRAPAAEVKAEQRAGGKRNEPASPARLHADAMEQDPVENWSQAAVAEQQRKLDEDFAEAARENGKKSRATRAQDSSDSEEDDESWT